MQPYPPGEVTHTSQRDNVKNAVKASAIMHIVGGSVTAALGCAAIGVKSRLSYVAVPVWSGLGVFLVTGLLGLFCYRKGTARVGMMSAYLGMSITSIGFAVGVLTISIVASTSEWLYECAPLRYFPYCPTSRGVRLSMDCLLIVAGAFEIAVSIVSTVASSYRVPCCVSCNRACCGGDPEPQVPPPIQMGVTQGGQQMFIAGQPVQGNFNASGQILLVQPPGVIEGQSPATDGQQVVAGWGNQNMNPGIPYPQGQVNQAYVPDEQKVHL